MDFNISLVSWVLSLLSFLAGTIVPLIYRKISFDGLVVKSILDRGLPMSFVGKSGDNADYFFMVLKYVNAKQQPFIIEEVKPLFKSADGRQLNVIKNFAEKIDKEKSIKILSKHESPDSVIIESDKISLDLNPLPFLIKGHSEEQFVHLFKISSSEDEKKSSSINIKNNIISVQVKVNGKFRSYKCEIQELKYA